LGGCEQQALLSVLLGLSCLLPAGATDVQVTASQQTLPCWGCCSFSHFLPTSFSNS
jgi:hypothetical protein